MWLENLGFAEKGKGWELTMEGAIQHITPHERIPPTGKDRKPDDEGARPRFRVDESGELVPEEESPPSKPQDEDRILAKKG